MKHQNIIEHTLHIEDENIVTGRITKVNWGTYKEINGEETSIFRRNRNFFSLSPSVSICSGDMNYPKITYSVFDGVILWLHGAVYNFHGDDEKIWFRFANNDSAKKFMTLIDSITVKEQEKERIINQSKEK